MTRTWKAKNKVVITRSGRTVTIDDRVAIKPGKGCRPVKGDKTKTWNSIGNLVDGGADVDLCRATHTDTLVSCEQLSLY